jgi:hypothetical protein
MIISMMITEIQNQSRQQRETMVANFKSSMIIKIQKLV